MPSVENPISFDYLDKGGGELLTKLPQIASNYSK